jgi:hypothetical protein
MPHEDRRFDLVGKEVFMPGVDYACRADPAPEGGPHQTLEFGEMIEEPQGMWHEI